MLAAVSAVCVAAAAGRTGSPPLYTNSWAVQMDGGPSAAETLAAKYGFINKGQVSTVLESRASQAMPPIHS